MNKTINVLAFPCGSEIALEVNRSLSMVRNIKMFGASSVDDNGRFSFDNYIGGVPFVNSENFVEAIQKIVVENSIDVIFPCLDLAIPILKKHEEYLGCKVVSSPIETAEICSSKRKTYQTLQETILVPKEFKKEEVKTFPVFLKPEVGSSSRNTFIANSLQDLDFILNAHPNLMVLEYLPGEEFTVDCFTDFEGNLKFVGARKRARIMNGISVNSKIVIDEKINRIAEKINTKMKMDGAWFFQLKKNVNDEYCLLEVAARFGGSSLIQRYLGVNFSHLSLLNAFKEKTNITLNDFEIETDRTLDVKIKTNIDFDRVYVDFDDTIILNDKVNIDVIRAIHNFINRGKTIILITKHQGNLHYAIDKFRLRPLFDEIMHIKINDEKSKYIHGKAIFIDDSYSERSKVKRKLGIPVFEPCSINCLIK